MAIRSPEPVELPKEHGLLRGWGSPTCGYRGDAAGDFGTGLVVERCSRVSTFFLGGPFYFLMHRCPETAFNHAIVKEGTEGWPLETVARTAGACLWDLACNDGCPFYKPPTGEKPLP